MKKVLAVGAALIGVSALIQRLRAAVPRIDWEQRLERMPDSAPPKWMFRNITAIRQNTDRILEILEHDRSDAGRASTGTRVG